MSAAVDVAGVYLVAVTYFVTVVYLEIGMLTAVALEVAGWITRVPIRTPMLRTTLLWPICWAAMLAPYRSRPWAEKIPRWVVRVWGRTHPPPSGGNQ